MELVKNGVYFAHTFDTFAGMISCDLDHLWIDGLAWELRNG